ncbi:MAG: GGDEF domain-containing protein [Burkholderiaceae bacterium]|nr:GGDEF domain-containing protein [Burkholderiaceae bacterium]
MDLPFSATLPALLLDFIKDTENGIAILNTDNYFVFHNAAFIKLFESSDTQLAESPIGRSFDEMMTWLFEHQIKANGQWENVTVWLDSVHTEFRSAPFRSFEIELASGRWLLMNEQINSTGEVLLHCADFTAQKNLELELKDARANLEKLAFTDELTGVANRRHFLARLNDEFARSRRFKHPLCLVMLGLDHFKRINDTYGHPTGDLVLRHFAALLNSTLRTTDIVGRLGGEEFAVALPETPISEAMQVMGRVRDALADERLDTVGPDFRYTFSGGVSVLPEDDSTDCNWLLASSDKALYQAKSTGRNKLVSYENAF